MWIYFIAFLWGVLEATVFFIVPDVFLSLIAIKHVKKALLACLTAALGALVGGTLLYFYSQNHFNQVRDFFNMIPGISPSLQQTVESQIHSEGVWAFFLGPTQEIPYKLYTLYASVSQFPFWEFLLISFPARLIRFILVTLAVYGVSRIFLRFCLTRVVYALATLGWTLFYAYYFSVF